MEACFSQITLDVIGKAVFNYEFNSLTTDSPLIQVCKDARTSHPLCCLSRIRAEMYMRTTCSWQAREQSTILCFLPVKNDNNTHVMHRARRSCASRQYFNPSTSGSVHSAQRDGVARNRSAAHLEGAAAGAAGAAAAQSTGSGGADSANHRRAYRQVHSVNRAGTVKRCSPSPKGMPQWHQRRD